MIFYWRVQSDKIVNIFLQKKRVGFGRTEVSVRLDGIDFCAVSSGHGPRGRVLKRFGKPWIFMIF